MCREQAAPLASHSMRRSHFTKLANSSSSSSFFKKANQIRCIFQNVFCEEKKLFCIYEHQHLRVICMPNAKLRDNLSALYQNCYIIRNSEANIPAFEIPANLHFVGCIFAQEQTLQILFSFCLFVSFPYSNSRPQK